MKKKLSKEELIERLKAIAEEEVPEIRNFGAMCYEQMAPPLLEDTCDRCGNTIKFIGWRNGDIPAIVQKIANLGYDAKVETLCEECCAKIKEELYPGIEDEIKIDDEHHIWVSCIGRNYLFYFRTKDSEPYHKAIADSYYYYQAVLAFLEGKSSYRGDHDEDNFLTEEMYILEFMTGLKIDD